MKTNENGMNQWVNLIEDLNRGIDDRELVQKKEKPNDVSKNVSDVSNEKRDDHSE